MARSARPPAGEPEPEVTAEVEDDPYLRRPAANFYLGAAFDFSELVQGAQVGLDVNFIRGKRGGMGLGLGAGLMGSVVTNEKKLAAYFPLFAKGGVRLGSANSEVVFRAGLVPAYFSEFGRSNFVMKLLIGSGFSFRNSGRGGGYIGMDLLVLNGFAHTVNIGWLL